VKLYFGACFFKGAAMHGRAKVRNGGAPSKIQHCVPAWTGIVLFLEKMRRTDSVLSFIFFFARGE